MWNLSSRIHKLNHFPDDGVSCYVKRDDELGCGINGSKIRKYASLIPFLIQKKIRHLIIIAGPQSNNLLAALQVARELQLQVTAFLIKPRNLEVQGNFKLSLLF
ncbi:MAG: 1-aminocyclopropane-1-carboxylate deaminase, partial [Ignavibacteria bacterium]|nr:1-aminocyclopropane-1-carboxylate deaminase [Ignavibacteria bacterium]